MNNDLYIKWETGYMNIHMDFFFPCSQQRFKKLLRVIALDWQHEDELKETLKIYFQNRIADLVELRKENGKKIFRFQAKNSGHTANDSEPEAPKRCFTFQRGIKTGKGRFERIYFFLQKSPFGCEQ